MKTEIPRDHLKIKDVEKLSRERIKLRISNRGKNKINVARMKLERALKKRITIYGVNTGFGALLNEKIAVQDQEELQVNLIVSHALGAGSLFEMPVVRLAMFLRANMLAKGYSGVRLELIQSMINLINRDVIPVVYTKGSVGASGDLAPLAFIALVLMGRGEAFYQGKRMAAKLALKRAGIKPIQFEIKEGLALINGTEMMSAQAAINVIQAEQLINIADIAGALSLVALGGNIESFDDKFSELKPYPGQKISAKNLRALISSNSNPDSLPESGLPRGSIRQNAYSLRCMPQVHGAVRDGIGFARKIVEIEMNSVTDNPIVFDREIISGGNFHGQALALAMDNLAISLCTLSGISERRIARLLDTNLSGLPAFLIPRPGINSGLMMTQLLAASNVAENKVLATPASIQSLPTSANQEDFVSMGMDAALKANKVCENTEIVLALELICSCQAIDLAKRRLNRKLKKYYDLVRTVVPFFKKDKELTPYLQLLLCKLKTINSEKN